MNIGGRGIQSIDIGIGLLAILANSTQPIMLRDLAKAAKMPPGRAHAYLVSFRKCELVEQDAATGRYRLGPLALHLGLARLRGSQAYQISSDAIVALTEELDLVAAISVWGSHGPTVLRIQEASHQIHANVRPGTVFGLTSTATGRLYAALLPEKLVEPLIKAEFKEQKRRQVPDQDMTLSMLRAQLRDIRRDGVATTEGRPIPGLNALSAPVFDYSGQMQLAITVMGPSAVVDTSPGGSTAAALLSFTRKLSAQLGYLSRP
jgi:DNA-binding IclR family transcriptional regulator